MSDFGCALRILRIARDLEQKQVAGRARVSTSQVSDYEKGKKLPSTPVLARLLEAMDFTPVLHAETMDFLRYLREASMLGESPENRDRLREMREVHRAISQIGRGATRLTLLAFRLLLR